MEGSWELFDVADDSLLHLLHQTTFPMTPIPQELAFDPPMDDDQSLSSRSRTPELRLPARSPLRSTQSSPPVINRGQRRMGVMRVGFKTMTEKDILEDGYRWRKYGKKTVKNNPHFRNYFKCVIEGCTVKKRVERDPDDPRYVLTAYEGVHNHVASHATSNSWPSSSSNHSNNNTRRTSSSAIPLLNQVIDSGLWNTDIF